MERFTRPSNKWMSNGRLLSNKSRQSPRKGTRSLLRKEQTSISYLPSANVDTSVRETKCTVQCSFDCWFGFVVSMWIWIQRTCTKRQAPRGEFDNIYCGESCKGQESKTTWKWYWSMETSFGGTAIQRKFCFETDCIWFQIKRSNLEVAQDLLQLWILKISCFPSSYWRTEYRYGPPQPWYRNTANSYLL